MKAYRNSTMDQAIGNAQREWKIMAKLAVKIREGRCNPLWAAEKEKLFTGIFKRLLTDPIDEVKAECR